MYFKEKMINGILHYQLSPKGEWHEFSIEKLSERIIKMQSAIDDAKTKILTGEYTESYRCLKYH